MTRTWEVSLAQLAGAGVPQARGLLGVLACFAAAVPIPVEGLDREVLGQVCGDAGSAGVGAGLEALLSVGLIEAGASADDTRPGRRSGRAGVMVHPLVAETIRHQLTSEEGGRSTTSVAVDVLASATKELNAQDPGDWPVWSAWLPHLGELLTTASVRVEEASLAILADTVASAAVTLVWAGSYAESLAVAEAGLRHTQRLGVEHWATIELRHKEASAHNFLGHAAEAERLLRDSLQAEERVLGTDHPNTLSTRYQIAQMVAAQGDTAEAERLYRDVLQAEERVLGTDHPSTRITARSLRALIESKDDAADG